MNPQESPFNLKLVSMGKRDFVAWLEEELNKRGWKPAELAQAAGLYSATLSRILNHDRQPGPEVAIAIARALEMPPDIVFRVAGLLPELPGPERDPTFQEILDVMKNMTEGERQEVLDYALWRYKRGK